MRRHTRITMLVLVALLVVASPVLAYLYRAQVAITESSSNSYDMLPVLWTQNNDWLAANGFMDATAMDTRMGTLAGLFKPWMVTDDKTLTAIPVPADSQTNLYFTTGESTASAMDIITGYGGYITIPDDPSLELGSDFEIEWNGYVDTSAGSDKNLVYKQDAFRTYVSDTTNITSDVYAAQSWTSPTGDVDNGWLNPTQAYNDNIADFAYFETGAGSWSAFIELTIPDLYVTQVRYYSTAEAAGGFTIDIDAYYDANWNDVFEGAVALSAWTTKTLASGQIVTAARVRMYNNDSASRGARLNDFDFYGGSYSRVTATGTSSGEHTVTTNTDSSSLYLGIGVDTSADTTFPITTNLTLNAPLWHTESDGATFTTKDTNEFTATVTGATWTSSGYDFDGASDYITVPHDASWDFGAGNFTMSAWLKTPSVLRVWDALVGHSISAANRGFSWAINGADVAFLGSTTGAAWDITVTASNVLATDTWYFLTMGRVGNDWTIYVNGASSGTLVDAGALANQATPLTIGALFTSFSDKLKGTMGEVRIYNGGMTPAEILQNYNATKWKYDGSSEYFYYNLLPAGGVPDNANDWVLNQNNVMPYADKLSITVGAGEDLLYEPTTIVVSTSYDGTADAGSNATTIVDAELTQANDYWNNALLTINTTTDGLAPQGETSVITDFVDATDTLTFPALTAVVDTGDTYTVDFGTVVDETANTNDGVITWGVNPAGVTATLGSMTSSGQSVVGEVTSSPTTDVIPSVGVSNWFGDGTVTKASTLANPFRSLVTMISDNTASSEIQIWRWFGAILLVLVTVAVGTKVRGHHTITAIAITFILGGMIAFDSNIFPMWLVIIAVLLLTAGIVSERSPSL